MIVISVCSEERGRERRQRIESKKAKREMKPTFDVEGSGIDEVSTRKKMSHEDSKRVADESKYEEEGKMSASTRLDLSPFGFDSTHWITREATLTEG